MTGGRRSIGLAASLFCIAASGCGGTSGGSTASCNGLNGDQGVTFSYRVVPKSGELSDPDGAETRDAICARLAAVGIKNSDVKLTGSTLAVTVPETAPRERVRVVGSGRELYMYDFARNVIQATAEAGQTIAAKETSRPFIGRAALYKAAKLASEQRPSNTRHNTTPCATPDRPEKCGRFYLFDGTRKLIAGPAVSRADLLPQRGGRVPAGAEVVEVPYGTVVLQAPTDPTLKNAPTGYYVLRDDPEIDGTQIRDPKTDLDNGVVGSNLPSVSFKFTNGGAGQFQTLTRRLARRGLDRPGQPPLPQTFATVLDGRIESRASIDPQQYPDGIDGRLGAQISGLTKQETEDLVKLLKAGPLPVYLVPLDSATAPATS